MTHEIHTSVVVDTDGRLRLPPLDLSGASGRSVRVTIRVEDASVTPDHVEAKRLLRGSVYRFDDPFGPAIPIEDWNLDP